jgi:AcrR family transcriptional regulator
MLTVANVPARRTQAQRSATTQQAIVATARDLIAERGFEATTIEEIARGAGVSKGALYHHYADKTEVLAAVYEHVEAELCRRLLDVAATETDPIAALRVGAHAFLDACLDPIFRRVALVEAPGGLGWARWREIDGRYGFGLLRAGLRAAAAAGLVASEHVEERAHLLLAALIEASLLMSASDDPTSTRAATGEVVDELIDAVACTARRPTRSRR